MNLALFDFDGTVTTEDTYTKFLFFSVSKVRLLLGGLSVLPVILLYKLGWLPASKTRPVLSKVAFWRRKSSEVQAHAEQFVSEYLPGVIREQAIEQINWHKQRGDTVIIVSANLDIILSIWCKQHGLQLVCSELEMKRNRLTGNYTKGDCNGIRKVSYTRKAIDFSQYETIFAYGDTKEDLPMLEMADIRYFRWEAYADINNLREVAKEAT
ncbi:HAD-IB family hydrolase [Parasalinivibrio latis]|uniref:HAD-IB family hydrolase n=1 Tax=Parasalinivibrio latis TaxID=2952610 RepID=UPI0030E22C5F